MSQRLKKLDEQKELADKLHGLLAADDGMIASSTMTCKNLEVAVAVSKRPGFFEYYVPPDNVKAVVRTNELGNLTKRIGRVQKELEQVRESNCFVFAPPAREPHRRSELALPGASLSLMLEAGLT